MFQMQNFDFLTLWNTKFKNNVQFNCYVSKQDSRDNEHDYVTYHSIDVIMKR